MIDVSDSGYSIERILRVFSPSLAYSRKTNDQGIHAELFHNAVADQTLDERMRCRCIGDTLDFLDVKYPKICLPLVILK